MFSRLNLQRYSTGNTSSHKEKYILARKCVYNYREAVGMISYLQGSTRPEISKAVH